MSIYLGKTKVDVITKTVEGGSETPSESTITLKNGVLRPDAEKIKTFSYDKYITADEDITIPAYTTSSTVLKASEGLQETYTITYTNYNWYVIVKTLTIPEYSLTSKAKGRAEYAFSSTMYEAAEIPSNELKALSDPTKAYTSRTVSLLATGAFQRLVYWSSGTAISAYATAAYGTVQGIVAPTLSSGVLTINTPNLIVRGHTTYFTNTYFNALTDIRYQWIVEIWRAPKSNLNLDGWGQTTQAAQILDCVFSSSQKLI